MISIDTNVLLRYLLADDVPQHRRSTKLINEKAPALITDVDLAETIWTLSGRRYQFDKTSICRALRAILSDQNFVHENIQVVWSALNDFENARDIKGKYLDFADALIANKSRAVVEYKKASFQGFYSFDKATRQRAYAKSP